MPLNIDPKLIDALVKRQVAYEDTVKRTATPHEEAAASSSIDPEKLALVGGLADAASTYAFMKNGSAKEDNAMMGNGGPLATGLSVAGSSVGMSLLRRILRKTHPELADALAANQGAMQAGYAAGNVNPSADNRSASAEYFDKLRDAQPGHALPILPGVRPAITSLKVGGK